MEAQAEFKKKILEPRLEEAKEGKRRLFFIDAAHFIHRAFLSTLWSIKRMFVRANSGWSRLNVLGAIDAVTKKRVHLTNTTTINAWSLVDLFRKLRELHPNETITLVLDNAKYYATFTEFMKGIEDCIEKFQEIFQEELNSLLTWNFQTLPKVL